MVKPGKQDIPNCRNPEFASWLWEWYKEAQEADSRFLFALRKAFDSMVRCEERLKNGREAVKLSGIGPGISERLERKLRQYIADGNQWHCPLIDSTLDSQPETGTKRTTSNKSSAKHYVPKFRSVGYGILLSLLQPSSLTKNEILRQCQPHTNIVVTASNVHKILGLLIKKELIVHNRAMSSYQLTDLGQSIAERLWVISGREQISSKIQANNQESMSTSKDNDFSIERWNKDDFDVLLLIDTREVKSKNERDAIIKGLEELRVPVVQVALVLGDVAFVARHKSTLEDVILDMLIERKIDSDLIASIPDGRFKEQKYRLRNCGLQNIVYLLEGPGEGLNITNFGEDKYFAAISQTMFSDAFYTKRSGSINETVHFLSDAYNYVTDFYRDGVLIFRAPNSLSSCCLESFKRERERCLWLCWPLQMFNSFSSKSLNLSYFDIFVQQLMCIRGVSAERAVKMAEQFGCHSAFLEAVERDPKAFPKGLQSLLTFNNL